MRIFFFRREETLCRSFSCFLALRGYVLWIISLQGGKSIELLKKRSVCKKPQMTSCWNVHALLWWSPECGRIDGRKHSEFFFDVSKFISYVIFHKSDNCNTIFTWCLLQCLAGKLFNMQPRVDGLMLLWPSAKTHDPVVQLSAPVVSLLISSQEASK